MFSDWPGSDSDQREDDSGPQKKMTTGDWEGHQTEVRTLGRGQLPVSSCSDHRRELVIFSKFGNSQIKFILVNTNQNINIMPNILNLISN